MGKLLNLTGSRFGSWTVVKRASNSPSRKARWLCACDCGAEVIVIGSNMKFGISLNCNMCRAKDRIVHGDTLTPFYQCWASMKKRCLNPNHKEYKSYGGRGITVCQEWAENYLNFKKDMLEGYSRKLSLERIDNNKGYYKGNCKWATAKEQQRNRRTNVMVDTSYGRITVAEASEKSGIHFNTLRGRVTRGVALDI